MPWNDEQAFRIRNTTTKKVVIVMKIIELYLIIVSYVLHIDLNFGYPQYKQKSIVNNM